MARTRRGSQYSSGSSGEALSDRQAARDTMVGPIFVSMVVSCLICFGIFVAIAACLSFFVQESLHQLATSCLAAGKARAAKIARDRPESC